MPDYFSKKDNPRAEEIAARTVNKERRAEDRAKVPPLRAYRKREPT